MFFGGHSNLPNIQNHPKSFKDDLATTHITAATLSHKDLTLPFTVLLIGTKKRMGEVLRSSRKRGNVVLVQSGPSNQKPPPTWRENPHLYQPSSLPYCIILLGEIHPRKPSFRAELLSQILQKPPPFHLSLGGIMQARGQDPRLCTYISYMYVNFSYDKFYSLDHFGLPCKQPHSDKRLILSEGDCWVAAGRWS